VLILRRANVKIAAAHEDAEKGAQDATGRYSSIPALFPSPEGLSDILSVGSAKRRRGAENAFIWENSLKMPFRYSRHIERFA